jgi:HAD superfamily hydrolase (TIGR01509 family)
MNTPDAAKYLIKEYGLAKTPLEVENQINRTVDAIYEKKCPLKAGAKEILEKFQKRSIKMVIATASCRYHTETALQRFGISDFFSEIYIAEEVGIGKSEPKFFELVVEKLGVSKAQTLVFEDSDYAIRAAKKAGLITVAVYDECSAKHANEIVKLTDYYIRALGEFAV